MISFNYIFLFLLGFMSSYLLVKMILKNKFLIKFYDVPNDRSLHNSPKPRIGGIAIFIPFFVLYFSTQEPVNSSFIYPLIFIFIISLIDDFINLNFIFRLSLHFIAAFFLISSLSYFNNFLITLIALISTVWIINLNNFMDGSDGLASGVSLIVFFNFLILSYLTNSPNLFFIILVLISTNLCFLLFNFPKAEIFMGDSGSISLGFVIAFLSLSSFNNNTWPLLCSIIIFSPFIVDSSVTLFLRVIKGNKFWKPHKEHFYQRLILRGYSHKFIAISYYLLSIFMGICSILLFLINEKTFFIFLLIFIVLIYILLILFANYQIKKKNYSE